MGNNVSPARSVALFIIMIGMVASGIAASVAISGQTTLALQICGGAIVLSVVVLLFGSLVVAGSKAEDSEG